ncbi:Heterokaryon incompatibility protein (HET) [Teratosphaeria destructans]|uniref:Heterokaryon incompatibility protein (HET) n=1 Tax=Teratosphaeria destructans TaxID=418781 RepID=A0A9W7W5I0_9PEZI|nr:Heterokaryon incompatibility protein (HET) [Teratosphaeria destructans]
MALEVREPLEQSQGHDRYEYRTLNQARKEIRLVLVQPASKSPMGDVSCSVKEVSLGDDAPKYETISYVWGDASRRGKIFIEGLTLDVPGSAEEVMRQMRHQDQPRTLWIDAVCINQSDVSEKTEQVSLMADIYSKSLCNLVWLGKQEANTCDLSAAFGSLLADARIQTNDFETFYEITRDFSEQGLEATVDYDSILAFYECTWFRRLWVIQEAALSPSSTCFYLCGDETGHRQIPLLKVLRAAVWLTHHIAHLPEKLVASIGLQNAAEMWLFVDVERGPYSRDASYHPHLKKYLTTFRDFEASEVRDHVNGLLGLYNHYSRTGKCALRPDYTRAPGPIFRDATRACIDEDMGLDVLGMINAPEEDSEGYPSWVPRWDRIWDRDLDIYPMLEVYSCNGSKTYRSLPFDPNDADILPVLGMPFQSVKSVISSPFARDTSTKEQLDFCASSEQALADFDHQPEDIERMLATTLVWGSDHKGQWIHPYAAVRKFRAWKKYLSEHHDWPRANSDHKTEQDTTVMDITKPGDIVAVLWGSTQPVTLRPLQRDGEFKFLGLCYVDGIMDGEALDVDDEGHVEGEQVFRLR